LSATVNQGTRRHAGALVELLVRNTVLVAAAAVFVAFSLASSKFAGASNLRNIAIEGSGSAVMAVGMTFVIITAGIDLSVGAILFLSTAGAAELFVHGLPVVWAPLVAVLFGVGLGALNGASIAFVAINPLIVTLATLNLYRGLGGHLTGFTTVYLPHAMTLLGNTTVAAVPTPIVVATGVALAGGLVLRATVFGRYVQAIGTNSEAARNLGLPVRRVLVGVYAISGLTAAVAGLIENGRLGALQPTVGLGEELTVITAVVLGGTSLFGGKGSIVGSLLGVALLQMVADGLVLARISPYVFDMLRASVLIVAVLVGTYKAGSLRSLPIGGRRRLEVGPPRGV
jgi:ribose/xylose/arabinose/galactoside ABC-type transport system permease subunit